MATKAVKRWTEYTGWNELPVLLTMTDLCAVLQISAPTALKMILSGELPGVKKGAAWYVEKEALRQAMGAPPVAVHGAEGIIEAVNALNRNICELLDKVRSAAASSSENGAAA